MGTEETDAFWITCETATRRRAIVRSDDPAFIQGRFEALKMSTGILLRYQNLSFCYLDETILIFVEAESGILLLILCILWSK